MAGDSPHPGRRVSGVRIALVHSLQDPGGKNIRDCLDQLLSGTGRHPFPLERHDLIFLETDGRLIEQDGLDRSVQADLLIFISRHASIEPIPVLTTHVTGNIGAADLGGKPGSVAVASPGWMHAVLHGLARHAPPGYRVSYEVTHHGPSDLETPSLFVEIGSTEKEWTDRSAGTAAAQAILEAEPGDILSVLGIGGNHYARRETEIALRSQTAFGHIVHTRDTGLVGTEMLDLLAQRGRAEAVFIDRKALKPGEVNRLSGIIRNKSLLIITENELLQLEFLSLDCWKTARKLARTIDASAELHVSGKICERKLQVIEIPADLLKEAMRVDASALKEGLGQMPVIYLSTSTIPVMPQFITDEENTPDILHDLISLCVTIISRGENTAIEGDMLVIRRSKFDPSSARRLGIPEGPLFGELMKGKNLNIDGREITPDMVCISEVKRIRIPGMEKKTCDP
jgi:D-aminoacyl-tRNA deacylase